MSPLDEEEVAVLEHCVLGVLHEGADPEQFGPRDFRKNPAFLRFLSRIIYEHVEEVAAIRLEAAMLGSGHVYLIDGRTADPGGRVPPEDIIGEVRVEAGTLVTGSFRHNPRHRLLTGRGFFQLPQELETVLVQRLRARATGATGRPD
ncbi:MAG TPA: hypothetical protein VF062_09530 [Candidatus Limnocylindrales bacterium]